MVVKLAAVLLLSASSLYCQANDNGQSLSQYYGCMACHAGNTRIMPAWPSFKEIADKYRGDKSARDKLIRKLKVGGKGVWGNAVEQPPYAEEIKDQNHYKILVDWVLSH